MAAVPACDIVKNRAELMKELRNGDPASHDDDGRGHCVLCYQRLPCDWKIAIEAMHEAADEIERLLAQREGQDRYGRTPGKTRQKTLAKIDREDFWLRHS